MIRIFDVSLPVERTAHKILIYFNFEMYFLLSKMLDVFPHFPDTSITYLKDKDLFFLSN